MFLTFIGLASCARYAFLYAGSNEFVNYRHQADIFTIYNQLLNRGFTSQNIALYAYDDIATLPENPFQGQVFHSTDHKTNFYPGSSAINVKGNYVTAEAFNNAIKYLPTTSEDYVLVYYDNHGGAGFLGTPYGNQIYWDDVARSFNSAESSHLYKKCLFIIEACYSGSVAKHLTTPNLAIITAANDQQSSYATVYDFDVGTYLTNEFTDNFISLIDQKPSATVGELYDELARSTTMSSACFYGDATVKDAQLSLFIGTPNRVIQKTAKTVGELVTPREATEKTLCLLARHPKASVRARARLAAVERRAARARLAAVLEMLAEYVGGEEEEVGHEREADESVEYLAVLRVFFERFGKVNPDDFGLLAVLRTLAASHTKAEIVQGIFAVI